MTLAPPSAAARTCSPSRAKSAERIDGASSIKLALSEPGKSGNDVLKFYHAHGRRRGSSASMKPAAILVYCASAPTPRGVGPAAATLQGASSRIAAAHDDRTHGENQDHASRDPCPEENSHARHWKEIVIPSGIKRCAKRIVLRSRGTLCSSASQPLAAYSIHPV